MSREEKVGEPLRDASESRVVWKNEVHMHNIAKNDMVNYEVDFICPSKGDYFDELVHPDGSPNEKEILRLRTAAASEYERRRNRDGGQRG